MISQRHDITIFCDKTREANELCMFMWIEADVRTRFFFLFFFTTYIQTLTKKIIRQLYIHVQAFYSDDSVSKSKIKMKKKKRNIVKVFHLLLSIAQKKKWNSMKIISCKRLQILLKSCWLKNNKTKVYD